MKTRTFFLVLAVAVAPLAGCDHDNREAVETGRDAQGRPTVHVDGDEVNRELNQASEHVERGAERAGAALERGAEQAGAALERGAEKVQREVGPVVQEALDDATITAKVKANLIADPEVRALSIDVDTIDGRVTLQGKVANEGQKAEAEKLARITPGVRQVVNLIQVGGGS
ncbi:MAG TPA: BON domain-containing protein [Thermoanaerobaculia bacterium]|jgi:osmotically-inducible protein OsmY|nr:BON domain-containing protein [Thermoanaerobaculia bacterium]